MLIGRNRSLASAVSLLQAGTSIDVVGSRGSGRSAFLQSLRALLEKDECKVIVVRGVASLRQHPLAAMHLAGIGGPNDQRASSIQVTVEALREQAHGTKSVLFLDDWDDLDESSWGVAESVRRTTGMPIVLSRLQGLRARHTPSGLAASTLEPAYVIDMDPIRFEELEQVLEAHLGGTIETGTMSRLYAKSGGIVGLARNVLDAAVREGRMVNNHGVWSAARDLWSPALRGVLEAHLENLGSEARDALEIIALVGVADVETVRKLVSWHTLELLEERAMLRIVPAGNRQLVTVVPPLLVEFFRNEPLAARRIRLTELIIDRLGSSDSLDLLIARSSRSETLGEDDALFVRLLQERARTRRIVTRAEWKDSPGPRTAVQYVRALLQTPGSEEKIAQVFEETDSAAGDPAGRVALAVLRAQWTAYIENDMLGALRRLRADTHGLGAYERSAEACAVLIETNLTGIPEDYAARLESSDDLPADVQLALLEAQMTVLISLGRFGDARRVFDSLAEHVKNSMDTAHNMLYGLVLLGLGEFDAALSWALRGIDEAHGYLDPDATRAHGYLAALCLGISGDYPATEKLLDTLFAMGEPPSFPTSVQLGLLNIASLVAIRRGNVSLGERYASEVLSSGVPDGPLPVQAGAWADAQLLAFNGQQVEAAERLWASSESLWARGARFSAVLGMLTSLEIRMDPARMQRLEEAIAELDSPYVLPHLEYLRSRTAGDAAALVAMEERLLETGRPGLAVEALKQASALFQEAGDTARAAEAQELLDELVESFGSRRIDTTRFGATAVTLTARELEIAGMIAQGLNNPDIASRLVLSVRTVESHINRIIRKTKLGGRADVVDYMNGLAVGR
ncbi:LuxR family transcriptional regulator [Leucobacter luti]|uniref:ATP/maltotriose-dependent transcriptional regulator MalT n=1 Tax=Leucobacter luti TaxID=340320 RepID=A0A4R6RVF0_9MICO|nr:LuxR family transcriptional regulator [Leucobacter luti]QYM74657.1 LuxR C-terminal-related transcriptional regulator [Leucobacter luti]TDP90764.1 ATP/maltotriose-dependent transcriptional regulator MalT [Leucobacter luti]